MIELKNVSKEYEGGVKALDSVSLKFSEGEVIVIKGMSGSGKSSMLSLIAGLSKPTEGEVVVDTKHISKLADHFATSFRRENIGMIFQKYNLIADLSVKENILLPLVPLNLKREELDERLSRELERFSLMNKKDTQVKKLSGGEQQRCAIARANINNPKIILADEPTANLDEKLSLSFIDSLLAMKSENRTIIIATHDPLFFDLDFVDCVVEMRHGKIV